ncbi:hypothetical protein HPB52_024492 [Rhipicephalus sanguineus]|uniref:Uncharacterized protein n=1 Tax=Rhipicephalus sanguineus TaxID=34632 RepID=A0A9D4PAD7_RHISA|nr:hypothetical protein HPB52_024492 [Rhipicephalus sanguineus]
MCDGIDPYELRIGKDAALDVDLLPAVTHGDIVNYLVLSTSHITLQQMKAYKSLDGHNYFTSGWVKGIKQQSSFHRSVSRRSKQELETFNTDAGETNVILQALCHKNSYVYVDGTRDLTGMLKADGVHPTKRGSQLLGCLLREAIKRACEEAIHDGAVSQQRQEEAENKELRFQYGDQEKVLAQLWTNLTNFPLLSADLAVAAAPSSPCKEMWADVVRRLKIAFLLLVGSHESITKA